MKTKIIVLTAALSFNVFAGSTNGLSLPSDFNFEIGIRNSDYDGGYQRIKDLYVAGAYVSLKKGFPYSENSDSPSDKDITSIYRINEGVKDYPRNTNNTYQYVMEDELHPIDIVVLPGVLSDGKKYCLKVFNDPDSPKTFTLNGGEYKIIPININKKTSLIPYPYEIKQGCSIYIPDSYKYKITLKPQASGENILYDSIIYGGDTFIISGNSRDNGTPIFSYSKDGENWKQIVNDGERSKFNGHIRHSETTDSNEFYGVFSYRNEKTTNLPYIFTFKKDDTGSLVEENEVLRKTENPDSESLFGDDIYKLNDSYIMKAKYKGIYVTKDYSKGWDDTYLRPEAVDMFKLGDSFIYNPSINNIYLYKSKKINLKRALCHATNNFNSFDIKEWFCKGDTLSVSDISYHKNIFYAYRYNESKQSDEVIKFKDITRESLNNPSIENIKLECIGNITITDISSVNDNNLFVSGFCDDGKNKKPFIYHMNNKLWTESTVNGHEDIYPISVAGNKDIIVMISGGYNTPTNIFTSSDGGDSFNKIEI